MIKMEKKEKNFNSYSELPEGEEIKISKRESQKGKENRDVGKRRIYKRSSYLKEKNNPERFSGEGINFRAKIIGIEDVLDARGNRMCQGALQKLKENVKLMGAHKQRIILNVSLNGIIIKDEKTGEILHHHPIHKISCISQDTKDNRAFGFVYGCPQTGHRFFAIKTEKAASQVVVTLRDLFLVALEIKKKEIEKASDTLKEDEQGESIEESSIDNNSSNGHAAVNNFFTSTSQLYENSKTVDHDLLYSNTVLLPDEAWPKSEPAELEPPLETLLDLQSEMDILQQGISQMDRSIASRDLGFSVSEEEVSESTSVPTSFQFKLDKLSSLYQETMSISSRSSSTSDYIYAAESKQEENETPKKEPSANLSSAASEGCSSSFSVGGNSSVSETSQSSSTVEDKYAVFQDIDSLPSIFDNPSIVKVPEEKGIDVSNHQQDESNEIDEDDLETKSSTPVPFSELDPLGNQPYVDKKDFFQDIKNPPKKVLKDLVGANRGFGSLENVFSNSNQWSTNFNNSDSESFSKEEDFENSSPTLTVKKNVIEPAFSSELFPDDGFSDKMSWESKNPFNPFLNEDYPDIPPPNSPPPPPPPRLPSLSFASSSSSPPPRPPSRVSCAPTPPLPKRKVPLLGSTQHTWFSFDQDILPTVAASSEQQGPPLPSPARKLPPFTKYESPPSSLSNSPATIKRLHNRNLPQENYSTLVTENGDSMEDSVFDKEKNSKMGAEASLSSRSVSEDVYVAADAFNGAAFNPFSVQMNEFSAFPKNEKLCPSPPVLPPKPGSFSRGKSSPAKKASFISSASSYSSSVAESSSSDTQSSLMPDCSNDVVFSSTLEVLSSNNSTNGQPDVVIGQETVHLQSSNSEVSDLSPDSIFRRKSDPFADDFFLTLHKKSDNTSKNSTAIDRHSDIMKAPT